MLRTCWSGLFVGARYGLLRVCCNVAHHAWLWLAPPPTSPLASSALRPSSSVLRDKQTWVMNKSTIIMPCNNTGFTDPKTTLGWGVVDFDWSNSKGKGTADGWAKHQPMDDEEMLFQQVQMTAAATPGTTVWVYRCSVYAYPWYTSVRALLDDSAYAPWFVDFKSEGPWHSPKCDSYGTPPKCSNHFHMQEQTPGFPHGDGDCAAPGCDCGKAPCGFYLWNHSSTAVVHNQTFQQWFINDYMLNKVGQSPLVSGFFWDDFWPAPGGRFPDSVGTVPDDTGLAQNLAGWGQITDSYHVNMDALRDRTLAAGKFAWQLLWTGGDETSVGGTCPHAIVEQQGCAAQLRSMCNETAPPQTRAMMYALEATDPSNLTALKQDLANFLLIRGPFAWLGHGWKGCSKDYPFPAEFNLDYGVPVDKICKETAPDSGIFTREWSNADVTMDCNKWEPTITWK
eukprot:m.26951 g.26951  ORF g.26951 m.26951 type:complete len:453 (+) comp11861_c0_seq1:244-1602(+)